MLFRKMGSQLLQRLKYHAVALDIESSSVLMKADECCRILDSRSQSSLKSLNLIGEAKLIICLDCAASLMKQSFDKNKAIERSGLSKKSYQNALRVIETLLELKKTLTVRECAVRLGYPQLVNTASDLVKRYLEVHLSGDESLVTSAVNICALAVVAKNENLTIKANQIVEIAGCNKASLERIRNHMQLLLSSKGPAEVVSDEVISKLSSKKRRSDASEICSNGRLSEVASPQVRSSPRKQRPDKPEICSNGRLPEVSSPQVRSSPRKQRPACENLGTIKKIYENDTLPTDKDSFEVWKRKILKNAYAKLNQKL